MLKTNGRTAQVRNQLASPHQTIMKNSNWWLVIAIFVLSTASLIGYAAGSQPATYWPHGESRGLGSPHGHAHAPLFG